VTKARSVRAAFQLYQQPVDTGLIELALRTRASVRSADNTMSSITLAMGERLVIYAFPASPSKTSKRAMRPCGGPGTVPPGFDEERRY
jgi:hypothetical protein